MSLCEPLHDTAGIFQSADYHSQPLRAFHSAAVRPLGKRVFDIVAGTAMALLALPVIVLLAMAVCVSLRTWKPLFLQERVGRGGRSFTVPKLRTLPLSTPRSADKYAIASIRTSRLGSFLRRTHIDELPQLLLVPLGTMSLVGPRPEMPWLLDLSDSDFVERRLTVRPGCSGIWQVSADAGKLIGEVPQYDMYYLENGTVLLDVWVLWRTLLLVAGRRIGSCADVPCWAVKGNWTGRLARNVGPRPEGVLEPDSQPFFDAEGAMW